MPRGGRQKKSRAGRHPLGPEIVVKVALRLVEPGHGVEQVIHDHRVERNVVVFDVGPRHRCKSTAGRSPNFAASRRAADPQVQRRIRTRGNPATYALVTGEERRAAAYSGTGDGRRHPSGTTEGPPRRDSRPHQPRRRTPPSRRFGELRARERGAGSTRAIRKIENRPTRARPVGASELGSDSAHPPDGQAPVTTRPGFGGALSSPPQPIVTLALSHRSDFGFQSPPAGV